MCIRDRIGGVLSPIANASSQLLLHKTTTQNQGQNPYFTSANKPMSTSKHHSNKRRLRTTESMISDLSSSVSRQSTFVEPLMVEDRVNGRVPVMLKPFLQKVRSERTYTMTCLLYTSPSPRDGLLSRMPSSA
eukprot:TRINITY_DN12098_c0_g1_i4.p1 TRINITY_DN12098_c0_g1~~TRINITY_DN12098_c0_g1_i4.p1  ORF type:complete len:132 (+),score=22.70 TRINITY_DN12098_c0_g1_i4:65-460(+)